MPEVSSRTESPEISPASQASSTSAECSRRSRDRAITAVAECSAMPASASNQRRGDA